MRGEEGHAVPEACREQILDRLEQADRSPYEHENFHERGMNRYATRSGHDDDMIRPSKALLEVLFVP